MTGDAWLIETYFEWLRREAFPGPKQRKEFEGVLRVLHDIPFYWTLWSDENRAGDALAFRQFEFLGFQQDLDKLDQHWLQEWAQATPSVLEVLLAISRRWVYYFEGPVSTYFNHLFRNMQFDKFPGRSLSSGGENQVRIRVDEWLSRQFEPNGQGSPFPVNRQVALDVLDMRQVDIWGQMNAYSYEHFQ
jgi:hypothetical protein